MPFCSNLWQSHVRKFPSIQIVSTLPSSSATLVTSVLMKITRSTPYSFWNSLTAFSPFRTSTSQTATFCNKKLPEEFLILALYQILPYPYTVAWSEILNLVITRISYLRVYNFRNYELWFLILTKYYYSDKIKEGEVGRACDACRRQEKWVEDFGRKSWRKDNNWKTWTSKVMDWIENERTRTLRSLL